MVVDDEEPVRVFATRALTRLGFGVITAPDGREALDLLDTHRDEITIVLLDLNMPLMSGVEVLREIRRQYPDLLVVLSSGRSEEEIAPEMHDLMPSGFVKKPYGLAQLADKLRDVCV